MSKSETQLLCPECNGPILYSEEGKYPDSIGFHIECKNFPNHLSMTYIFPNKLDVTSLAAAFVLGWEAAGGKTTIAWQEKREE